MHTQIAIRVCQTYYVRQYLQTSIAATCKQSKSNINALHVSALQVYCEQHFMHPRLPNPPDLLAVCSLIMSFNALVCSASIRYMIKIHKEIVGMSQFSLESSCEVQCALQNVTFQENCINVYTSTQCRRLLVVVERDPTIVPSLLQPPDSSCLFINSPILLYKPSRVWLSSSCFVLRQKMFVPVSDVEIFLFQIRGWERKPWGESSADTVGEWHRLSRAQILI